MSYKPILFLFHLIFYVNYLCNIIRHCTYNNFVEDDVKDNLMCKLCGLDHKIIASYYNKIAKETHYKNVIIIC